ncbi:M23 family metallopeptidase [Candidatus Falkowbacteria bacterium]|nr:M23 family metallopeptidase [Candidatus Falkowbacteria bacterium]
MIFLKRLLAVFFVNLALKPILSVLRFIFYKVLVKLYLFYFSTIKRLGLADKIKNKSATFFINQKLAHVAVAALTIFFVIFNLTQKTQAVAPDEIAGKTFLSEIISNEFSENDQLIEEYFDEQAAITPVQQTYLDNLTAFKPQPMAEMTAPEDSVLDMENLSQGGDAIRKPDLAATSKTQRPRENIIDYIVQAGDTVSTIASNFGISVNTILWENDLNAYSLIRPGNKLVILPISGVAHKVVRGDTLATISSKYGVDANIIMEANKLASAEFLSIGQKLIVPGGKKTYYIPNQASGLSPVSLIKDLLKPQDLRSVASNKLAWPTVGARLTQYYSWRHHAIDIANKTGTPIYACDTGVVEVAGWGTGYGNQIVIDHGGGRKSRYAHLSKFYVKKGESVKKGEAIAAMGSTGRSTGPHLHFEYIINGIKYNPLNYLK